MESKRIGEEIEILLGTQTTREKSLAKKFRSNDAVKVKLAIFAPKTSLKHYEGFWAGPPYRDCRLSRNGGDFGLGKP